MAGKGGQGNDRDEEGKTGLVTKTRPKTKKPSLYKVLLLNDDYTPMEFVVHVLEKYFSKGREEATRIMLHVHHKGVGICGVFTYEVAETKVTQVMDFSRQHGHPLTVHHGERVGRLCHPSRKASKPHCTARSSTPTSAAMNSRRSSICSPR